MLTPDMIEAENFTTALTSTQKINLELLVRGAFPAYATIWATQLQDGLVYEMATPTERTRALKAVLTQLNELPAEDVESQGDVNSPTFFSTQQNWKSLAIDVFNVFGIQIAGYQQSHIALKNTVYVGLITDTTFTEE